MTVHGIMEIHFDEHGDYDAHVRDPLYLRREDAIAEMKVTKTQPGVRLELVHFHVV